jgi:deoxyribonuclease-4
VLGRALAADAEVAQVFSSNPRVWPTNPPDVEALAEFGAAMREHRLPLFLHAIYLINPASHDEMLRARSAGALTHALVTGALAGAAGVVTHLGSHRGEGFEKATSWVTDTIHTAWAAAEHHLEALGVRVDLPTLLLETAAGSGATVGGTLKELKTLLGLLPSPLPGDKQRRSGLCLDTAHMFVAGYALHQATGLASVVGELKQWNLLSRVGLVHLNDSSSPFASKRDRHANPGEGELGFAGLARVVTHPVFTHIPFVLEVPGSDGHGPSLAEITQVKTMRPGAPNRPVRPGDA